MVAEEMSSILRANEAGGDYFWVLRHETLAPSSPEAVFVIHLSPALFVYHQGINMLPAPSSLRHSSVPYCSCGLRRRPGRLAECGGQYRCPSFCARNSSQDSKSLGLLSYFFIFINCVLESILEAFYLIFEICKIEV